MADVVRIRVVRRWWFLLAVVTSLEFSMVVGLLFESFWAAGFFLAACSLLHFHFFPSKVLSDSPEVLERLVRSEQRARHRLGFLSSQDRSRAAPAVRVLSDAVRLASKGDVPEELLLPWAELADSVADGLLDTDGLDPIGFALDDAARLSSLTGT